MRFFGNMFAWLIAGGIGYVLASSFSTQFVLQDLAALGAPITVEQRVSSTWSDILGAWQYFVVVLAAFAVGFFIASLVKAYIPFLARVAYPVAGAAAIAAALSLMKINFGIIPVIGAQTDLGFLFQVFAGGLGGLAFEALRPKKDASS
ncbi:hypothetical protein [Parvularcula sp. IMCC14364]|uniref:hypothetical protein n=1 Tax=Parvularcula sp. IMCC14364 TaxID=3067902 RepID=UPI002741F686|nr:hypothetical protein [Parvularcula sp. IMCC14364]